jgi:hypothetical protein
MCVCVSVPCLTLLAIFSSGTIKSHVARKSVTASSSSTVCVCSNTAVTADMAVVG